MSGVGMDWRLISGNMFIANYQSQEAIDNDDGSAYYNTTGNFLVYGENGLKSDFGGHDNRHSNNVYAYITGSCMGDGSNQLEDHEDWFMGNRCVLMDGGDYGGFPVDGGWPLMGGNEVYARNAEAVDSLGLNGETMAEFQSKYPGVDDGSKAYSLDGVSEQDIVDWGRKLLMKAPLPSGATNTM